MKISKNYPHLQLTTQMQLFNKTLRTGVILSLTFETRIDPAEYQALKNDENRFTYISKCCNISPVESRPLSEQRFPFTSAWKEKKSFPATENCPIWMSNFRLNIFINMYRTDRACPGFCRVQLRRLRQREWNSFFIGNKVIRAVADKLLKPDYWITENWTSFLVYLNPEGWFALVRSIGLLKICISLCTIPCSYRVFRHNVSL